MIRGGPAEDRVIAKITPLHEARRASGERTGESQFCDLQPFGNGPEDRNKTFVKIKPSCHI